METALTSLIPTLASKNVFGEGEFVSIENDSESSIGAQFCSTIATVNLTLREKSGELRVIPLVVKVQTSDEELNETRDSNAMFHNEIKMYSDILPILDVKKTGNYPRMYYGFASGGEDTSKDILIMENLKVNGFVPPSKNVFIDFHHISLAMKSVGRLHAMSYSLKHADPQKFQEIVGEFKDRKEFNSFFESIGLRCMRRGIEAALKSSSEKTILINFSNVIEPLNDILKTLHTPDENFGVILHGDYCKNNLLFKYDNKKKVNDCAYFDFQFSKYGCPVVDVAFFLYMHTSVKNREEHWDEYLEIYWKSVEENVLPDLPLPSFKEFQKYFASRAVIAYYYCSFFLPVMVFRETINFEEYFSWTPEKQIDFHASVGGREGEQLIHDIVIHLLNKKYIQGFLEWYSLKSAS